MALTNILFVPKSPPPPPPTLLPAAAPLTSIRNPRFHQRQNPNSIPKIPFSSSSRNGSSIPSPETECPVPLDQQPVNEYQSLSSSFPFSWASGDLAAYSLRLLATGVSFNVLVGLPVTWFGTVRPEPEPAAAVLGAVSSGIFVVTLAVLRMYLGWAYVGNRLLSATVEYEETGWYDGQIWVKTAEVLARDRLLGSFSVKPVLSRLKFTLVGLGALLLLSAFFLINTETNKKDVYISKDVRERAVAGVYSDQAARSFEPDAFCGEPDLS